MDRPIPYVLDSVFRANPDYDVVTFEQMTWLEREALASLREDPECSGILRPKPNSGLRLKSVCNQTSRLFQSLQNGGKLPSWAVREAGPQTHEQIVELLLEDVLQISRNGRFESGARVHDLIHRNHQSSDGLSRLARMSHDAVKYGQKLALEDPLRLSAQMYFYNRVPVTPHWNRRIGSPDALSHFLGIDSKGCCRELLETGWKKMPSSPHATGWNAWLRSDTARRETARTFDYKIYVSPILESMPDALPAVLEVFAAEGVQQFKFGADLSGLARPDKIVAYFEEFEHLERVANSLAARMGDTPAHGVPFTAELAPGGLLSWGMDPHEAPAVDGQDRASWRVWITNRLARSLIDARRSRDHSVEPWRFALERLALDGVDTDTFAPTDVYQEKIQR